MTINNAMYNGVSGLTAELEGMEVISNNISNSTTKAYKSDRAEFEDMLSSSNNENGKIGRGVRMRNATTVFNQGAVTGTGQITDLAIQGEGFFAIRSGSDEVSDSKSLMFTRDGSFRFDREGKMVDLYGSHVQGYMIEDGTTNRLSPQLSDLQIISNNLPPQSTQLINVVTNLDVREKAPPEAFDVNRPAETSNFVTTVNVYDNYGMSHQASIYFARTADSAKNTWDWHAVMDGKELTKDAPLGPNGKPVGVEIAKGNIEFDANGHPITPFSTKTGIPISVDYVAKTDATAVQFANGAKADKLQFNFGPVVNSDGTVGSQTSSSNASKSVVQFHSQDGYEAGYLRTLKIEINGDIKGVYTNGLERRLGAVALASFPNIHGLQKAGRNNYLFTPAAGEPSIGTPLTGNRGTLFSSSLEESNVDLARQFVDMIITQRSFQANGKAITTSDTLLDEIINLKR